MKVHLLLEERSLKLIYGHRFGRCRENDDYDR